ncbi:FAD-binding protein [Bianquea renquensis]|jgi:fumarate reductase/succinate dehydrogenase flavoprotein domain protein|uniref:FAD-binding protein n=1 Tax=Bianquea renquensis TaxID=2763661 RepID=A0A926DXQ0_9FIRM|nr:FAD-binding protein [Bianquea renquensis]MBC8545130.1 FAD-binding protein [Bianquea renquensis]
MGTEERIEIAGVQVKLYRYNTVIVGSGAAALNCADRLYQFGQKQIAIVTEGMGMGTSRNTGSDKQTYYKLTMSGDAGDSVEQMARTLFEGGAVDGDLALTEAALSARSFFKLVEIGVPFPHNEIGEFVGYKTDHDPRQRATSAGPLTSRYMTERLQEQVEQKEIPIYDGYLVIRVLTSTVDRRCVGVLCLNKNKLNSPDERYVIFAAKNIVYGTGGPAGLYAGSVYPPSQHGATGLAFEGGVKGKNLTEWQYGLASTKFRWNLSGTYQQVLPRYVSTDANGGDEREFLRDYFDSDRAMLDAIFLKGYQWPFDPRKVEGQGSSLIDILVYQETQLRNRRVFLDYLNNPSGWDSQLTQLSEEGRQYLLRSSAVQERPVDRLNHMNPQAIDLYRSHGIDLFSERLEIAVCAQHNNGGLSGNVQWESNICGFFPIGEVNGSHGVYRPGGTALNAGQCGSLRAAWHIASKEKGEAPGKDELTAWCMDAIQERIGQLEQIVQRCSATSNLGETRMRIGERMSRHCAHIREAAALREVADAAKQEIAGYWQTVTITGPAQLPAVMINYDLLLAQQVYTAAMAQAIEDGVGSRGSYLVVSENGKLVHARLADDIRFVEDDGRHREQIQEAFLENGEVQIQWRQVRPIPQTEQWFETVWKDYEENRP